MTSSPCELVKALAADPRRHAEQVRRHVGEILAHVDVCEACETILDEAKDAEGIFEVLASEETLLPPAEREALDRWITPDTKREAEVHDAVMELIKGLSDRPAQMAGKFSPSILHATTEAVSLAISGCIGRDPARPPWVELRANSKVTLDGKEAMSATNLAAEIAVFTNHWADSGAASEPPAPSSDAFMLAHWSFLAVRDQRHLFRDFRAMPPVFGLPFMSDDHVVLVPLRREERIDNLYERWRPDSLQGFDTLYIARSTDGRPTGGYHVVAVPTARVVNGLRDETIVKPLRELGLGGDADVFLGRRIPSELDATTIGGPLQAKALGHFDAVTFRGRSVELWRTSGQVWALQAERIVWRWDVLNL